MQSSALFTTRKRRNHTIGWLGLLLLLGAALLLRFLLPKPAHALRAFLFGDGEAVEEALACWKSGESFTQNTGPLHRACGRNFKNDVRFVRTARYRANTAGAWLRRECRRNFCVPQ